MRRSRGLGDVYKRQIVYLRKASMLHLGCSDERNLDHNY
jgi:hypothetical protein